MIFIFFRRITVRNFFNQNNHYKIINQLRNQPLAKFERFQMCFFPFFLMLNMALTMLWFLFCAALLLIFPFVIVMESNFRYNFAIDRQLLYWSHKSQFANRRLVWAPFQWKYIWIYCFFFFFIHTRVCERTSKCFFRCDICSCK